MTTTAAPGAGPTTPSSPQKATLHDTDEGAKPFKRNRPRWVMPLTLVGVLLAVTTAMTLLNPGGQGNGDDLDPANPGFSGAQGLARVLGSHGVSVTVVRSQRELLDQIVDGTSTVVITHTIRMSRRTAHLALAHAASAASVVLLDPDPEVTRGMGLPVESHLTDLADVAAGCSGAGVDKGFRIAHADRAYTCLLYTSPSPRDS